ncbi:hypothetical protein D3C71_71140 [compost metagenome]
MNEDIIINLSFNEKIERDNQNFYFKYIWKSKFTELKKSVIYSIIFLTIGFAPIKGFEQSPIPYVFKYVGFLYIAYIFLLTYQYIQAKKKTHQLIEEHILDLKNSNNLISKIILTENAIEIKNIFYNFGSVWDKTNYKFVNDYLIVGLLKGNLNFIFTKAEFNNSDYDVLLNHLQKHSRQQK